MKASDMSLRHCTRAALLAGALLAVPATSDAATVATTTQCSFADSAQQTPIVANIAGLAASQSVSLRVTRKGQPVGSSAAALADAAGNLQLSVPNWSTSLKSDGSKEVTALVEAVDTATGQPVASTETKLARLGYSESGSRTARVRTWKVQGLAGLAALAGIESSDYWIHYENNGKYRGRQKLGKAQGPCGYMKARRPLTPFSKRNGRYDVYITTSKKLDKTSPFIFKNRIVVTRL